MHTRWAEWMVNAPLLILMLGNLLRLRPKYAWNLMLTQFLVIILGYAGEIITTPWRKMLCFFLSLSLCLVTIGFVCLFCSHFLSQHVTIPGSLPKENAKAFSAVKHLTWCILPLWALFPLTYSLNLSRVLPETYYLLLCPLLDFLFKGFFLGLCFMLWSCMDFLKQHSTEEEIKELRRIQENFLRYVYHEIRNPFNIITLGLDFLQTEVQSLESTSVLATLKKSAASMTKIIDDALNVSESKNHLQLIKQATDLKALVRACIRDFRQKAENKDITLVQNISEIVPAHVMIDQSKVMKMFRCLLSNAVKFSRNSSTVEVCLKLENFTSVETNKCTVTFSVVDCGFGIPKELISTLLEPFANARPGDFLEDEDRGSGLSLCMTKILCDLMGAKIYFKTAQGLGSTFFISLECEECFEDIDALENAGLWDSILDKWDNPPCIYRQQCDKQCDTMQQSGISLASSHSANLESSSTKNSEPRNSGSSFKSINLNQLSVSSDASGDFGSRKNSALQMLAQSHNFDQSRSFVPIDASGNLSLRKKSWQQRQRFNNDACFVYSAPSSYCSSPKNLFQQGQIVKKCELMVCRSELSFCKSSTLHAQMNRNILEPMDSSFSPRTMSLPKNSLATNNVSGITVKGGLKQHSNMSESRTERSAKNLVQSNRTVSQQHLFAEEAEEDDFESCFDPHGRKIDSNSAEHVEIGEVLPTKNSGNGSSTAGQKQDHTLLSKQNQKCSKPGHLVGVETSILQQGFQRRQTRNLSQRNRTDSSQDTNNTVFRKQCEFFPEELKFLPCTTVENCDSEDEKSKMDANVRSLSSFYDHQASNQNECYKEEKQEQKKTGDDIPGSLTLFVTELNEHYSSEHLPSADDCGTTICRNGEGGSSFNFNSLPNCVKKSPKNSLKKTSSSIIKLFSPSSKTRTTRQNVYCSSLGSEIQKKTGSNNNGTQILIVDDVKSNLKLTSMILKKSGYNCDTATNGVEAIEMASKNKYSLIFMDNVMPIMNGIEATRQILSFDKSIAIIGLTGNVVARDQEEFMQAGIKLLIQKPADKTQLLKVCRDYCNQSIEK